MRSAEAAATLLGLKDQLPAEENELGAASQQVASLLLERDTYKRQSDIKSTVENQ